MPLPLTVSCFSKIQIGFTFLVPAHPGSPGKRAVKWYVCVCSVRQIYLIDGSSDAAFPCRFCNNLLFTSTGSAVCAAVDVSKAFDTVGRWQLFQSLVTAGIPYSQVTQAVWWLDKISEHLCVCFRETGVFIRVALCCVSCFVVIKWITGRLKDCGFDSVKRMQMACQYYVCRWPHLAVSIR